MIQNIFALKLRELRKENNLTLVELAQKIGVSVQQLQKYEKGINYPSIERILLICNFFQVDMNTFFPPEKKTCHIVQKELHEEKIYYNVEPFPQDLRTEIESIILHLSFIKNIKILKKAMTAVKLIAFEDGKPFAIYDDKYDPK